MIITDEQIGYFVFIKVRGNDIFMEWLMKTNKHGYQCIRPVGREISTINLIARVF